MTIKVRSLWFGSINNFKKGMYLLLFCPLEYYVQKQQLIDRVTDLIISVTVVCVCVICSVRGEQEQHLCVLCSTYHSTKCLSFSPQQIIENYIKATEDKTWQKVQLLDAWEVDRSGAVWYSNYCTLLII